VENRIQTRRSLKYIRLAAFLADQPASIDHLEMSVEDIEKLIGESLPTNSRYPSWWRNDDRKMHARAWLTAGWIVQGMNKADEKIVFTREGDIQ
jgi:peptidoglycan/xylan/chitin deacetylase (PgdA/CDA1 family)